MRELAHVTVVMMMMIELPYVTVKMMKMMMMI